MSALHQHLHAFSISLLSIAAWMAVERLRHRPQYWRVVLLNIGVGALALLAAPVAAYVTRRLGFIPRHPLEIHLPYLVAPILGLWIFDFFYYWFHRLQHTWPVLWRFHAVHHSDEHVNASTTLRHHWTEEPFRAVLLILPMSLAVQFDASGPAVFAFLIAQWPYFIHADVRWSLGPLTPFIAGPQFHRIHHSREAKHVNRNFSAYFPVWDILFGTYEKPDCFPETGIGRNVSVIWPKPS